MGMRSIKEIAQFAGKKIFVRADFNVQIEKGKIVDDFRIVRTIPTIKYLAAQGAKVIIAAHLGRPKGVDKKLTLKPVQKKLEELMARVIPLVPLANSKEWQAMERTLARMKDGEVILLENIRFLPDEEKDTGTLAKDLSSLFDIFVLDGFGVAHRAAATVSGMAKFLPSYAGLLLNEEVSVLSRVTLAPKKPLVVILGGAKAETKIPVLKRFLPIANTILVGGGIANTYWWAKGNRLQNSLIDKNFKKEVLKYCVNKKVVLPVDVVVGTPDGKRAHVVEVGKKFAVPSGLSIRDVGPRTVQLFSKYIKDAETLIWNGALGVFEQSPYQYGTYAVSHLFAARSKGKAFGVCGGGETVQVFQKLKNISDIDLVSTGGGAMLEFLSGKKLPAIEALEKTPVKKGMPVATR